MVLRECVKKVHIFRPIMLVILLAVFMFPTKEVKASTTYDFSYTGGYQKFEVTKQGLYKVELWGSQGGKASSYYGGKGGYTSGTIFLKKGDVLYVYVGGKGTDGVTNSVRTYAGGYNGGANGYVSRSQCSQTNAAGGGATDIRLKISSNGAWNDATSLNSRIMVAAGGGGAHYNYCSGSDSAYVTGGAGGGLTGGTAVYGQRLGFSTLNPTGGTQTNGGQGVPDWTATSYTSSYTGSFGQGGTGGNSYGGGGGGYYGGASGVWQPGAGGSSYISGHKGSVAIKSESDRSVRLDSNYDNCKNGTTDIECSKHYSGIVFENTTMLSGTENMPTHGGEDTMKGNSGNGYAKFTILSSSENNYLTNLVPDKGTLSPTFNKETTSYTMTIDKYSTGIAFSATLEDEKAIVTGLDHTSILQGETKDVDIAVTSESGDIRIYTVSVTRPSYDESTYSSLLKDLKITNTKVDLKPYFDPTVKEYNVDIKPNEVEFLFDYSTYDSEAKVKIENASNFTNPTGTVKITVSEPHVESTVYKINYTKVDYIPKSYTYKYNTKYHTFTAETDAEYKVELWGASGGNAWTSAGGNGYCTGGKGAYTSGNIKLNENDTLYTFIGGKGANGASGLRYQTGGYNGGGMAGFGGEDDSAGSGGGATDVRLKKSSTDAWNDDISLNSRIMVAAGGGGANCINNSTYTTTNYRAGAALNNPSVTIAAWSYNCSVATTNQVSGYGFGQGAIGVNGETAHGSGGGGGGYYGGRYCQTNNHYTGAQGGTSYISGHTGAVAITAENNRKPIVGCATGTNDISCSIHYSGRSFSDTVMKSGLEKIPTQDGTSTMTGNSGHGFAKFTFVRLLSKNNFLSSLITDKGTLSSTFSPEITEYELTLDTYDKNVTINGNVADENATAIGFGTYDIDYGEVKDVNIAVTSESGVVKQYTIKVKRKPLPENEHSSKLSKLMLTDYKNNLEPLFDSLTYNYNLVIPDNEIDVNIETGTYDTEAKVKVEGNKHIFNSSGTIKITVSEPHVESTIYTINYTKISIEDYTYNSTNNYQTFVAPITGKYKFELWGAQGGIGNPSTGDSNFTTQPTAGKGAYTSGYLDLKKDDTLYVFVGGKGSNASCPTCGSKGGYNGGGDGINSTDGDESSGAGGGATDVRLKIDSSGTWNNLESLNSRIMIAAGGGGSHSTNTTSYTDGMYGGALEVTGQLSTWTGTWTPIVNQTTGGAYGYGVKGRSAEHAGGGGGGGYYGGYSNVISVYSGRASGGSSYISGYKGAVAIKNYNNPAPKINCETGTNNVECSYHYSGMIFDNPIMKSGLDEMPSHDGTSTTIGNSNDGYAKITLANSLSNNNYLFDLKADKGDLSPEFDTDTQEYTLNVDSYATSVKLDAEAYDDNAIVTGAGEYDLSDVDELDVDITVTAESGRTRIYTVHIEKKEASGHSAMLKKLYLTNYPKLINYNSDISVYNIEIPDYEVELPLEYVTFDKDATVKVTGNTFNSVRKNTSGEITLVVEAPGCEPKIYKINWTKKAINEVTPFKYTGGEQVYTTPLPGEYKLEIWGASGGMVSGYPGGYGGYSVGTIRLDANKKLYVNVGEGGQCKVQAAVAATYNGGGSVPASPKSGAYNSSGGGATHIAEKSGVLSSLENNKNSVIIVAGGGGGGHYHWYGKSYPGSGGGITGTSAIYSYMNYGDCQPPKGGTQTAGGTGRIAGSFGKGGNQDARWGGGGGGGWYGGSSGTDGSACTYSGAGGSGYIGNTLLKDKKMVVYSTISSYASNDINTKTEITSNVSGDPISNYAKSGNGYAKITYLRGLINDNYLLDLKSDKGTLSPSFDSEKNEYTLTLDGYAMDFTLSGTVSSEYATVVGLGKYEVDTDTKEIEVAVTSEAGETRIYKVHVIREDAPDRNIKLKKLNIEDSQLTPEFYPTIEEYTVEIPSGAMSVDVEAIPFDSTAKVTIEGNGYLRKNKKNVIVITVEKEGVGKTVYKVNVEREGSVEGEEYKYGCTGEYQEFISPATAYYKIEAWGASGGYGRTDWSLRNRGGFGAYTKGEIRLKKNEKIYIYVGCQGQNGAASNRYTGGAGGWNGGAQGGNDSNHDSYPDAGGGAGGASDIRLAATSNKKEWNEFESLKSRIMVAAGGGGGNYSGIGGAGGTLKGTTGHGSKEIATQTSGYKFGYGQLGITDTDGSGGGAGGYYGGFTALYQGGGGGSSYVSGCNGCNSISEDSTVNDIKHTNEAAHYSGYVFDTITMLSGDESMPSPNGGYTTGNNGDGQVIITGGRDRSENNYLEELTTDKGELTPVFTPQELNYSIEVGPEDDEITINGKLSDDTAVVTGLGKYEVPSGETKIPVTVTAENGDIRIYNVTVTREMSSNSKPEDIVISGLAPSLCALNANYCNVNPQFNPNTNQYEITVPARIKQIEFTVVKGHRYQKVVGDGIVSLQGGSNLVTIEVTSEDSSSTSRYTYNIVRDMTGDTTIEDLKVVDPSVNINFDPDLADYYFSVPNEYESVELEVTLEDEKAKYEVIGNENFVVGNNLVIIRVTAQNGETKDYTLNIYREKSGNIFLSSLKVKNADREFELNPVFNKITTNYTVYVENDIDSVEIFAEAEHPLTTIVGIGEKSLNTGVNNFDIVTTSENGDVETYKLSIIRAKNSDATLKQLDILEGVYSPEFDKDINEYSLDVEPGVSSLHINAIPTKDTSRVTITGNSGFRVGLNTVNIIVTAEDGSKNTYVIKVNRIASTNNNLTAINTDRYSLLEEFDKDTLEYSFTLDNDITDITVTALKEDNLSRVTGVGKYNLKTGLNDIDIKVTAENGDVKTYTLHVTRKQNSNADLFNITTDRELELNPTFDKDKTSYTAEVDNEIESINVIGIPYVTTSTVSGNGTYNLVVGENTINLTVTAEDSTQKEYSIVITRKKSSNAYLKLLYAKEASITPTFNKRINEYTIKVLEDVTSLNLEYVKENEASTVQVIGNSDFEIGENEVLIKVTSEDKSVTNTYKLNVIRQVEGSSSSKLSSLSMVEKELEPTFDPSTMYYEVEVPYSVSKATLEGSAEDIDATVIGLGEHDLIVGKNILAVKVTSTEGIERTYQVVVNRLENDEARLSNIIVDGSVLAPAFDKDIYEYNLSTQLSKLDMQIIPIDVNATVQVEGNSDFTLGENEVKIIVTAKDGHTTREYILHVEKEKSNNNNLAWLKVSGVNITPAFSKTTTVYYGNVDREVNSVLIEGEAEDINATVDGLGNTTLEIGKNYKEITVTSQSGNIKKYTVVITRAADNNNYLASLTISDGVLSPVFSKTAQQYNVTVPYETDNITLSGYAEVDTSSVDGLKNYNLSVGNNKLVVKVTAENSEVREYTVNVVREPIVSSLLEDLTVKDYSLSPDFNSELLEYNLIVPNEVEQLDLSYVPLDKNATVTVTGNKDFVVGMNTVEIKVTDSKNITSTTYKLNINRQNYANTYLAYISVSKGTLEPLFNKKTLTYDVSVPNDITSITIDAEAEVESNTVDGIGTFNLELGNNKIPITVTTPSGIKRVYYVNVYRELKDDNYLLNLQAKVEGERQTITPKFDKETGDYTIDVAQSTTEIEFIGEISDGATVEGLGTFNVNLGENTYKIVVTSESGKVRIYNIVVNRPASSESHLISLIPSSGSLTPSFTYMNGEYTLKLDSSVNFLSFEYTTVDRYATVTGADNQIVPDGESTRVITVTAEDKTVTLYTVKVIKDRSDEARLKQLKVNGYNLDPVFEQDTFNYTITVPNSKKTLLASEVEAVAIDSNATISKGNSISLSPIKGNLYAVEVTAKDGFTKQTYYINVIREKGSNALLKSLKSNIGEIEEAFDSNTFTYTLTVPNGLDKLTSSDIEALAMEEDASVYLPSKVRILDGKANKYEIKVVSGDKTKTNTYTLNIQKKASSDATLRELLTDIGIWKKKFNSLEYNYRIDVAEDAEEIIVNATANNYATVLSGTGRIKLENTTTEINVVVQAEDGTLQVYELKVVKSLNSSKVLDGLSLGYDCNSEKCPLDPVFDSNTFDYEVRVTNEINEVNVKYIKNYEGQQVKVYDNNSNEITDTYKLNNTDNLLRVEVTNDLGETQNYTIYISREKSKNNYLKELSITNPQTDDTKIEFDKYVSEYYITVPDDVKDIELNALKEHSRAIVRTSGTKELKEGNNDIIISVQAENGDVREYIIHALKTGDSNNYLESITVSSGVIYKLSPKFNKGINDYVTTVPSNVEKVNIDAVPELDTTTVLGTGEKKLKTGVNSFDITSTSKEGKVATYHVIVNKEKSDRLYLKSLDVAEASLDPEFDKEILKYSLNVSPTVDTLSINAIPEEDDVEVKIVGNKNLISGANNVYIVLSNKDKTVTTTYVLEVNKDLDDNNYLKSLKVNDTELMSLEKRESVDFDITVDSDSEQINLSGVAESNLAKITGEGIYSLNYGNNEVKLVVTSEVGTTRTYTINVNRKYNNDLFMISTDRGELSPTFDKDTLDYYLDVERNIENINILAVASSSSAQITGNGYHALDVGENIIPVTVSSADDSSKTYNLHITRKLSSDATLENLYVQEGVLDPVFDPNTNDYTVEVPYNTSQITIDYLTSDNNAVVEIIGNEGLKLGENTVKVKVTAEDKTENTYTIKVVVQEEAAYSNRLKSLTVDNGKLSPDFDPDINSYTVTVNNDVNSITLTGVLESVYAKSTGLGKHNLELGRNELPIVVTSKDGKTRTYSVIVYRIKSSDARLKLISFKEGQISPLFDKDTHMYTMTIDSNVSDLTETIEPLVSGTTYEITGNHSLALGENIVTITSTAADLESTEVYTIKVTKEMSADNFLESLETNIGKIEPDFSKDNTGPYVINVDDTVNSLILSGKPVSSKSTVTGLGVHQIKRGSNTISVIVTSEIGTTRTYTVIVNKALNSDNSLYLLKTSDGDLEPEFDKDILEYTVKVDSEVSELTVLGLATNSYAKVDGNGKYTLNDGVTTISLTVTAEDGKKRIYKLNVEKEKEPSSKIMELNVHEGVLSPTFDKNTLEYSITVPNEVKKLTMDIKLEDSDATYIVEGNNDFKVGSNQVFIKVTSKNNVVTTYTLNVIRQTASNNYLKSLNTTYDITPAFNRTTQYYEIEVEDDIASIEVNGEAEDSRSTVTGFGTYDLAKGDNYIYITVTSASGVDRIYTVKVTRKLSSDNKLSKLSVNTGDLNPLFNPDVNNYKIDIASGIEEINIEAIPNNINAIVNGSGLVSVKTGENLYEIIVTAEDGSTNVYKIEATKNSSNNTNIENIIPSSGVLSPNYSNSIDEYEVEVEDDISLISFDVVLEDSHAKVSGHENISLNYGDNDIKIKVEAEDGTEKIVNINVVRCKDITEINVDEENILMAVDDIYELKPTLLPEDATNKQITYSSSDESIITVDEDGNITSHTIGDAEVTIASKKNPHIKKTVKVTVLNLRLESDIYDVRHNEEAGINIVIGAEEKTTLSEIQSSMKNNDSLLKFYDLEANEITDLDNTYVATGQIITLEFNGKKYDQAWIVLRGDNTEDSAIDVADYNELRKQVLGKNNFEGYLFKSVDIVEDDEADVADYNTLKQYLLGKIKSLNNLDE